MAGLYKNEGQMCTILQQNCPDRCSSVMIYNRLSCKLHAYIAIVQPLFTTPPFVHLPVSSLPSSSNQPSVLVSYAPSFTLSSLLSPSFSPLFFPLSMFLPFNKSFLLCRPSVTPNDSDFA